MNSKDRMALMPTPYVETLDTLITEILGVEPKYGELVCPWHLQEKGKPLGSYLPSYVRWELNGYMYELVPGAMQWIDGAHRMREQLASAKLTVEALCNSPYFTYLRTFEFSDTDIQNLKNNAAARQMQKEYLQGAFPKIAVDWGTATPPAPVIPEEQETPDKVAWWVPCYFSDRHGEKRLWQTNTGRYLVSSFITDLPGVSLPPELFNGETMVFPANAKGEFDTSELACVEGPEPQHEKALREAGYRPIILAKWI